MEFEVTIVVRSREQLRELFNAAQDRIEGLVKGYEAAVRKRHPTRELERLLALWDGDQTTPGLAPQLREQMRRYQLLTEAEAEALNNGTIDLFAGLEGSGATAGGAFEQHPADE